VSDPDIEAFIDDVGGPVTLRRVTGTQQIRFDVGLNAVVVGFRADEMAGGIIQGDRMIIVGTRDISNRQWPAPPRKGDKVIQRGVEMTIESVDVVEVAGQIVRYNCISRGAEG
jgi:hypothetical protein